MAMIAIDKGKKFSEFFDEVDIHRKVDFIVLHHVQADSVDHAIEQFVEHGVSAHFLIDESGTIFELVEENNIAYHAGVSFWRGVNGLNETSIGIEFVNRDPFAKRFEAAQLESGAKLCHYLIDKYNVEAQNIVGHSDIGYCKDSGFLNRKQDPSHFFDWKWMAQHGVGIYPDLVLEDDEVLFQIGDENPDIAQIKQLLSQFGYKIDNMNAVFNEEMACVAEVFNRRFNQDSFKKKPRIWYQNASRALSYLVPRG